MRIQERLLAALLPFLCIGLGLVVLIDDRDLGGLIGVLVGVLLFIVLEGLMGSPTTLVIDQDSIAIYAGFYGLRLTHKCSRADVKFLRVRKVTPFSILEFLRLDGSLCLNTTTNWLTRTQLRQISSVIASPIENLDQAEVYPE